MKSTVIEVAKALAKLSRADKNLALRFAGDFTKKKRRKVRARKIKLAKKIAKEVEEEDDAPVSAPRKKKKAAVAALFPESEAS